MLIEIPKLVVGVDEVGLGALAGPMTVCAVAAPADWRIIGLGDSKTLTDLRRRKMSRDLWGLIVSRQIICSLRSWTAKEIDWMGVAACHRTAIIEAVKDVSETAKKRKCLISEVIIDGNLKYPEIPKARSLVKADSKIATVSAASIIAKVYRDDRMSEMGKQDFRYGFAKHKGYPTEEHNRRLMLHGPSEHHRMSYAPVARAARMHGMKDSR